MQENSWYVLSHPIEIDSPALMVFPQRIKKNINEMIRIAGDVRRLIPHIKTHKMAEVIELQLAAGINKFKCATIAEAELLAHCRVSEIIMAYQLNETKINRFIQLVKQFPDIKFYSLIDNKDSLHILQKLFGAEDLVANVYIDVDVGMHRTGIPVNKDFLDFYETVMHTSYVKCHGLHVYDGHIHISHFEERKKKVKAGYQQIEQVIQKIKALGYAPPHVIAGGSPSFTVHALNPEVDCSPGTCLLWDKGYADMLPEQHFLHAAVLLTRVISKPAEGILTTDLGHKSLAPENPIQNRISFFNLDDYEVASQSEEHMVIKVSEQEWKKWKIGDVLYGIPFHICPTVASYDEVQVVENGKFTGVWQVAARKRKIKI